MKTAACMGHLKSLFSAALLCAGWIILPQVVLGNSTSVRMVDGSSSCSGRVQVLHLDKWGAVCYEDWDLLDANVVCGELGCGKAQEVKPAAYFGKSSGPVWMDKVKCVGNESSLIDCPVNKGNKFGENSCQQNAYAGVICQPITRLVSGNDSCSGRVEVLQNGIWGTVCDDLWDLTDAAVVCREVGCGNAFKATSAAYFGQGSGPVWLADVNCTGNEQALGTCEFRHPGTNDCSHSEDAGVVCQSLIRLTGDIETCSGSVELFHNGTWKRVCGDGWDQAEASVVCREMGCGELTAVRHTYFSGNTQTWMSGMNCTGEETALHTCPFQGWGPFDCSSFYAGAVCDYPVRLMDGSSSCSGRVEIFHDGLWGAVNNNGWDLADAAVVCEEIGCGTAIGHAYFGQGTGPVWINSVNCLGSESSLMQCNLDGWMQNTAGQLEHAGVVCNEVSSTPGNFQDSGPSVKILLRIELKVDSSFDPNHPKIWSQYSEEIRRKLQKSRPFISLTWKTQTNGQIFQNVFQKKNTAKACY